MDNRLRQSARQLFGLPTRLLILNTNNIIKFIFSTNLKILTSFRKILSIELENKSVSILGRKAKHDLLA